MLLEFIPQAVWVLSVATGTGIDLHDGLLFKATVAETLTVELGPRSYPIHFQSGKDALTTAVTELRQQGRPAALLTDAGVVTAHGDYLDRNFGALPRLTLAPGEQSKSLEAYGRVLDFLAAERITRQGVLWVVGGGVMGDLGGFAAASYLRGIDYIQVPTTLLAMVDSSVGGKTGINLIAGKNLAGAFHHPRSVYIAPDLLATLPAREFAAGMAEVIKYGLLGDASLFVRLENSALTPGSLDLSAVIRRCCGLKAGIIQADEFERAPEGGRALLNLGHTFGHAIEQVTGYTAYLHGESVAIGLAGAARLAQKLRLISAPDVGRVERVLAAHGLPVRLRTPLPAATARDKKNREEGVRFVVLNALGAAATRSGIPSATVEAVWRELGAV
jgi:3-dehydroquinate synthase